MDNAQAIPLPTPTRASRFMRFPLTRMIIGTFLVFVPLPLTMMLASQLFDKPARVVWPQLLAAVICFLAYRFFVQRIDKRPMLEFSRDGAARELIAGVLTGVLLVCAVFGILGTLGIYQFEGMNEPAAKMLIPLAEMILVGLFEEMVMRGILFRTIEQSLGSWLALLISGLLFGLLHLPNAGSNLLAVANVAMAGILFATAYMMTRRLWLPIGMHIAWNFAVAQLFSSTVSGHGPEHGLLRGTLAGPQWLTGGEFGVEASIATFVIISAAASFFLVQASRRGQILQPFWRRKSG